jgi:hypothetical protein
VSLPWIPAPPGWLGRAASPEAGRARWVSQAEPGQAGLVYLILLGDQRLDDRPGWRRGRSVLRAVAGKLARTPGLAYQVRAMSGGQGAGTSKLRRAGRLPRRDLRRSAWSMDFAQALGNARLMLRRDQNALEPAGEPTARPAIVFFAVDPPLADAVSAEEYAGLAQEASVTWVVPDGRARLLSPAFAAGDARVLTDHDSVADEVARRVLTS